MRPSFLPLLATATVALAALTAAPSSLAYPAFGPAQPLTTTDGITAGGESENATAATNGTDFLVTWKDSLAGPTVAGPIECARLSADQVVLDAPSIRLSVTGTFPQAFWDGAKYVVVAGGSAQRIDPASGAVEPAFALSGAGAVGQAALQGGRILDVWQTASGGLAGALFDETGSVVHGGLALTNDAVTSWQVASSGSQFLVAWTTGAVVDAVRVSSAGAILDATPIAITPSASSTPANLAAAASTTGYLLSWNDTPQAANILAARIDTAGAVADPAGTFIGTFSPGAPNAAWDGSEWWIVSSSADAYTLPATGATVSSGLYSSLGTSISGLVVTASTRLVVSDFDGVGYAAVVTPAPGIGSIVDTDAGTTSTALSSYPNPQVPVCVAASSAGYLVAWREVESVYGLRFQLDGTPIDATPFPLGTSEGATACGAIGASYYVATDAQRIPGSSFYSGAVLALPTSGVLATTTVIGSLDVDGGPADYGNPLIPRSMACLPDRCLLTWSHNNAAYATLFGAGGSLLSPTFDLSSTGWFVATDGTSFLVGAQGEVLPVAADGSHTAFVSTNAAYPSGTAGHAGTFVLPAEIISAGPADLFWFDGAGAAVGLPDPAPMASPVAVWDGTGFFLAGGDGSGALVGAEVPGGPFDAGAAGAAYPLLPSYAWGAVLLGSAVADHVIVVASQPSGVYATPRLVGRFATSVADAGADAGEGAGDAGVEADSGDGGNDASAGNGPDASTLDAAADGAPGVEGADGGAAVDATASASTDGGDGGPDGSSGGCGCAAAGTGAAGGSFWAAGLALVAFLAAVRRRPRTWGAQD